MSTGASGGAGLRFRGFLLFVFYLGGLAFGELLLERGDAPLQLCVGFVPPAARVATARRRGGRRARAIHPSVQPHNRFRRRFRRAAVQQRPIQRPFGDFFLLFAQHQAGMQVHDARGHAHDAVFQVQNPCLQGCGVSYCAE